MGNSTSHNQNSLAIEIRTRIEECMVRKGILKEVGANGNQSIMANILHVDQSAISKWKNRTPGLDTLVSIAHTLDVSLDWLITGKDFHKEEPAETKKEPDSVEPVQTEKDIEDYTIEDICKGIAALTCIPRTTTQIIMNYDWLSSPPYTRYG